MLRKRVRHGGQLPRSLTVSSPAKASIYGYVIAIQLVAIPAHATNDTKQELREFGWEGTWSQDCSVPNVLRSGTKAILPRLYDRIPVVGAPTRTVETIYESGPLAGTVSKFTFTVTSAKIIADNKLVTVMVDESGTETETVLSMIEGKLVALRSEKRGIASRDIPAGVLSVRPLRAGEHFDFVSAENGVAIDPAGNAIGSAVLEKCRE